MNSLASRMRNAFRKMSRTSYIMRLKTRIQQYSILITTSCRDAATRRFLRRPTHSPTYHHGRSEVMVPSDNHGSPQGDIYNLATTDGIMDKVHMRDSKKGSGSSTNLRPCSLWKDKCYYFARHASIKQGSYDQGQHCGYKHEVVKPKTLPFPSRLNKWVRSC